MQLDSEQRSLQAQTFISYFDVASNFAWRESRTEQIEQRRALVGDALIYDLLLSAGGIKQPDALYPPTDVSALKRLLDDIEASQYDALKKECLVYYLLKWHLDGREDRFQLDRCIPPHFTALADAYWLLDTGFNVPRAVSILSDARLNQDLTSKVLQTISLAPNSPALIVKYIRTAQPAVTEPSDLELYTIALAESSLCDAWEYQRTFNEISAIRSRLFKALLEWSVTPKPKPAALKELLFLPLSSYEQSLLRSYAVQPPPSMPPTAIAVLQDLVCMRLVQACKYADAIKVDHEFTVATSTRLKGLTLERTKMAQDLYTALPAAERLLLDEELKRGEKQPTLAAKKVASSRSEADISMSSSWEDVRMPQSLSPGRGKVGHIPSLRDRDMESATKSLLERSRVSRVGEALSIKPTTVVEPPIIPISSIPSAAARPAPRKSFPPSFIPLATAQAPPRPRHAVAQVPSSSSLDAARARASPFASRGPSTPEPQPVPVNGASTARFGFTSANKSQNAFYQPLTKLNGNVSAMPMDDQSAMVEEAHEKLASHEDVHKDVDEEMEDASKEQGQRENGMDNQPAENPPNLHISIFGNHVDTRTPREHAPPVISNGSHSKSPSQERKRKNMPPGAFLTDDDDGMSDEHEEEAWEREHVQTHTSPPRTRRSHLTSASAEKPVAAEKRSTRPRHLVKEERPIRSIPGTLMEEDDEEEDHIAPLRQSSPQRRVLRKGRSSTSSDHGDELEGPQTRRRSSRLTASHTSVVSPEPEPSPTKKSSASTRTRKSTKPSTTKRKR
ncbi:hypothetical protein AX17_002486 [Amanita inopinata Kibby_2008]|nr:hypothetical protein AX17_002486 [Amanita inopinata Kibby_2008]